MDFSSPLDISGYVGKPNAYIEMWLRPYFGPPKPAAPEAAAAAQAAQQAQPQPAAPAASARRGRGFGMGGVYAQPGSGAAQAPSGAYSPGAILQRNPRRFGYDAGYGTGGMPGSYGAQDTYPQQSLPVVPKRKPAPKPETPAETGPAPAGEAAFRTDAFRVQLTTDQGTAVLPDQPIYPGSKDASSWVRVGFPLRDFKGPIGGKLDRIAIFGERRDTVYIGQVKLVLDNTPIEASPAAYPAIASVGKPVTFLANARAGLAPVNAVWDFDNSNGIQAEATGLRVMNVYDRPGDYEATVTITDATGASPEKRTYIVLVRVM